MLLSLVLGLLVGVVATVFTQLYLINTFLLRKAKNAQDNIESLDKAQHNITNDGLHKTKRETCKLSADQASLSKRQREKFIAATERCVKNSAAEFAAHLVEKRRNQIADKPPKVRGDWTIPKSEKFYHDGSIDVYFDAGGADTDEQSPPSSSSSSSTGQASSQSNSFVKRWVVLRHGLILMLRRDTSSEVLSLVPLLDCLVFDCTAEMRKTSLASAPTVTSDESSSSSPSSSSSATATGSSSSLRESHFLEIRHSGGKPIFQVLPSWTKEASSSSSPPDSPQGCSRMVFRFPNKSEFHEWLMLLGEAINIPRADFPCSFAEMTLPRPEIPSENCEWVNCLIARYFRDMVVSEGVYKRMYLMLQKRFDKIKVPDFVGPLTVVNLHMGQTPPQFEYGRLETLESGASIGELMLTYDGGISIKLRTEIYINWPKPKFKTIPMHVSISLESMRGKLRLHMPSEPKERCSMAFLAMPDLKFDIQMIIGSQYNLSSLFPRVKDFMAVTMMKMIYQHMVSPNRFSFYLPLPGQAVLATPIRFTTRRSRKRRALDRRADLLKREKELSERKTGHGAASGDKASSSSASSSSSSSSSSASSSNHSRHKSVDFASKSINPPVPLTALKLKGPRGDRTAKSARGDGDGTSQMSPSGSPRTYKSRAKGPSAVIPAQASPALKEPISPATLAPKTDTAAEVMMKRKRGHRRGRSDGYLVFSSANGFAGGISSATGGVKEWAGKLLHSDKSSEEKTEEPSGSSSQRTGSPRGASSAASHTTTLSSKGAKEQRRTVSPTRPLGDSMGAKRKNTHPTVCPDGLIDTNDAPPTASDFAAGRTAAFVTITPSSPVAVTRSRRQSVGGEATPGGPEDDKIKQPSHAVGDGTALRSATGTPPPLPPTHNTENESSSSEMAGGFTLPLAGVSGVGHRRTRSEAQSGRSKTPKGTRMPASSGSASTAMSGAFSSRKAHDDITPLPSSGPSAGSVSARYERPVGSVRMARVKKLWKRKADEEEAPLVSADVERPWFVAENLKESDDAADVRDAEDEEVEVAELRRTLIVVQTEQEARDEEARNGEGMARSADGSEASGDVTGAGGDASAEEEEEGRVRSRKRRRMRARAINEILQTECDYVRDIRQFARIQRELKRGGLLPDSSLVGIFSNVAVLCTINRQLLMDLLRSVRGSEDRGGDGDGEAAGSGDGDVETTEVPVNNSDSNNAGIGRCFLQLVDYLKMYSAYSTSQGDATRLIDAGAEDKAFRNYLRWHFPIYDDASATMPLKAASIKPIQRLCKYPLLLRELIRHSDSENDEDYAALKEARERIEKVVSQVNRQSEQQDNIRRIVEIQARLTNADKHDLKALLTPTRRILREGAVTLHKSKGSSGEAVGSSGKPVWLFLFNDMLIIALIMKKRLFNEQQTDQSNTMCKIVESIPGDRLFVSSIGDNMSSKAVSAFAVGKVGKFRRIIECSSSLEKDYWMKAVADVSIACGGVACVVFDDSQSSTSALLPQTKSLNAKDERSSSGAPPPLPPSAAANSVATTTTTAPSRLSSSDNVTSTRSDPNSWLPHWARKKVEEEEEDEQEEDKKGEEEETVKEKEADVETADEEKVEDEKEAEMEEEEEEVVAHVAEVVEEEKDGNGDSLAIGVENGEGTKEEVVEGKDKGTEDEGSEPAKSASPVALAEGGVKLDGDKNDKDDNNDDAADDDGDDDDDDDDDDNDTDDDDDDTDDEYDEEGGDCDEA
eukprot:TRINITY_DN4342_c0_g1_i1.p1 TRINITY_DN4342_c0_g1~~TRINITY_DN4342_c0_g1_i1.p1  ORF type:complete len:1723 (-),score=474.35 TRINITY_DN4342_c0_g1_i1:37-5205(-)